MASPDAGRNPSRRDFVANEPVSETRRTYDAVLRLLAGRRPAPTAAAAGITPARELESVRCYECMRADLAQRLAAEEGAEVGQ